MIISSFFESWVQALPSPGSCNSLGSKVLASNIDGSTVLDEFSSLTIDKIGTLETGINQFHTICPIYTSVTSQTPYHCFPESSSLHMHIECTSQKGLPQSINKKKTHHTHQKYPSIGLKIKHQLNGISNSTTKQHFSPSSEQTSCSLTPPCPPTSQPPISSLSSQPPNLSHHPSQPRPAVPPNHLPKSPRQRPPPTSTMTVTFPPYRSTSSPCSPKKSTPSASSPTP